MIAVPYSRETTVITIEFPDSTLCWNCNAVYPIDEKQCPHCCAANANIDPEVAQEEVADKTQIEHEWKFRDDSFSHEYGTEVIHYWECERCGATRNTEPGDYYDEPSD